LVIKTLDSDPDLLEMLDPDPYPDSMNPDPQPFFEGLLTNDHYRTHRLVQVQVFLFINIFFFQEITGQPYPLQ
jgi:hypothetical protein